MFIITEDIDPNELANHCARMSCPRWNSSRWRPKTAIGKWYKKTVIDSFHKISRRYYRKRFWAMAQAAWETGERQRWINLLQDHDRCISSYPWPYCDRKVANWENQPDTLVLDPSGCIVKDSTSYCAWKIYEYTGKWPTIKSDMRVEAKNWQYFLSVAGYPDIVEKPIYGHHYIAIEPHDGPKGMVFWFEHMAKEGGVVVSTYRDKRHSVETIKAKRIPFYIWIRID